MIKKIFKFLLSSLFIGIAIFLILFSLNRLNMISLDFSFLNEIPGWNYVNNLELKSPLFFNLIVFGVSIIFSYLALNLILSMVPIIGKITKIILKIVVGWILILSSIALIITGVVGFIWFV